MNWINLTDHNILLPGDNVLPPSGRIARCHIDYVTVAIVDGVELTREILHSVTGLPPQVEGTMYIVSSYVRRAANYRNDLASPGKPVRDRQTLKVLGVLNLVIN